MTMYIKHKYSIGIVVSLIVTLACSNDLDETDLENIVGEYQLEVKRSFFSVSGEGSIDTTTETITIGKLELDKFLFKIYNTTICDEIILEFENTDHNRYSTCCSPSNYTNLHYYFQNDSISVVSRKGSIGSNTTYTIHSKLN